MSSGTTGVCVTQVEYPYLQLRGHCNRPKRMRFSKHRSWDSSKLINSVDFNNYHLLPSPAIAWCLIASRSRIHSFARSESLCTRTGSPLSALFSTRPTAWKRLHGFSSLHLFPFFYPSVSLPPLMTFFITQFPFSGGNINPMTLAGPYAGLYAVMTDESCIRMSTCRCVKSSSRTHKILSLSQSTLFCLSSESQLLTEWNFVARFLYPVTKNLKC